MASLPQNKKLKKVSFVYEDESTYLLDEKNSEAFQKNMDATSIIAVRSYNPFLPVEWIIANGEEDKPKWLNSHITKRILEILSNSEGIQYVEGEGNTKAVALNYLLGISKANNDRNNFGIKKCTDYIDTLMKANGIVNQYAKDYSPKREVRFPTEEDMHCPSADCGNVTPHILQKANTSDGSENKEELWTCMLCSHQLK